MLSFVLFKKKKKKEQNAHIHICTRTHTCTHTHTHTHTQMHTNTHTHTHTHTNKYKNTQIHKFICTQQKQSKNKAVINATPHPSSASIKHNDMNIIPTCLKPLHSRMPGRQITLTTVHVLVDGYVLRKQNAECSSSDEELAPL